MSALDRFFYENLIINHAFHSSVCVRCPLYTVSALGTDSTVLPRFFSTTLKTHIYLRAKTRFLYDLLRRNSTNHNKPMTYNRWSYFFFL